MLGLAVLFGLIVWVAITLLTIKVGASLFIKKNNAKYIGAFLGFMLTMGGFVVYWTVEYLVIQNRVSNLCKTEGGVKIYVTPEEWRKQIGEKEWGNLVYTNDSVHPFDKLTVDFRGKKYKSMSQINPRIQACWAEDDINDGVGEIDTIYYDTVSKQVLVQEMTFNVGIPAIANSFKGLKFWINKIDDCPSSKLPESLRFLVVLKYTNHQTKEGNQRGQ